MPDLRGKSHLVHLIDCPGHVNFSGECTAALRAADSACLVVGAVEGVLLNTERLIKHALRQHVPLTLVINKVDRLILELKLPPADAYHKLVHTIDRVNAIIEQHSGGVAPQRLSPEIGNVCFASAQHGWCFSLLSFATLYVDHYWAPAAVPSRAADAAAAAAAAAEEGELDADATTPAAFGRSAVDASALARRLWGDRYFDAETGRFSRRPAHGGAQRSFVSFCLEPLYKVYSAVVGEESELLQATLAELGMQFRLKQLHIDAKPLMRLVMSRFFDGVRGFTSMVATHVPSPIAGAVAKVERSYLGQVDDADPLGGAMRRCEADADGPLVINVVKLVAAPDGLSFFAYGRIMCGTVRAGQRVRVLGETYSADDTEDMREEVVRNIFIPQARYQIAVDRASAGNCVLLEGVDAAIIKSATIVGCSPVHADAAIFAPLEFDTQATVKLAVEPLNPSELPKLLHGLRCVSKSYPLVSSRVEESGEHVVFGCGEMDLDCVMHDLREMYGGVEIKVADPVVAFCETVLETSHMPVFGDTPNGMNQFTLLAEPLEKGLAEDIEGGGVSLAWDSKHLSEYLCSKCVLCVCDVMSVELLCCLPL
jgi:U5 small nuclear ribonucleoprotein component